MSRQDPAAAEGKGVYPTFPDCVCTHSYHLHDLGQRAGQQVRTRCSTTTAAGSCGCRLYRSAS